MEAAGIPRQLTCTSAMARDVSHGPCYIHLSTCRCLGMGCAKLLHEGIRGWPVCLSLTAVRPAVHHTIAAHPFRLQLRRRGGGGAFVVPVTRATASNGARRRGERRRAESGDVLLHMRRMASSRWHPFDTSMKRRRCAATAADSQEQECAHTAGARQAGQAHCWQADPRARVAGIPTRTRGSSRYSSPTRSPSSSAQPSPWRALMPAEAHITQRACAALAGPLHLPLGG